MERSGAIPATLRKTAEPDRSALPVGHGRAARRTAPTMSVFAEIGCPPAMADALIPWTHRRIRSSSFASAAGRSGSTRLTALAVIAGVVAPGPATVTEALLSAVWLWPAGPRSGAPASFFLK